LMEMMRWSCSVERSFKFVIGGVLRLSGWGCQSQKHLAFSHAPSPSVITCQIRLHHGV
jgi:hypothetical protein